MLGICKFFLFLILFLTTSIARADCQNHTRCFKEKLKLSYHYPESLPITDLLTYGSQNISGSLELKLIGIHDIVLSQVRQRLKHFARNKLREYYSNTDGISIMTSSDFSREMEELETSYNPYGQWWDRPWYYSLPHNKGGAPKTAQIIPIGWNLNVPKNFPIIHYLKKKFEAIGDIWVRNNQYFDDIENGKRTSEPNEEMQNSQQILKNQELDFVVTPKENQWFSGNFYHLRFRPSMTLKDGNQLEEMMGDVALRIVVELYAEKAKLHFANFSFQIKYDTINSAMLLSSSFVFLTW